MSRPHPSLPQKVRLPAEPTNEDFSRLERAFDRALALPATQRDAFILETASDDPGLQERLRALLVAHDNEQAASDLLQQAALENSVPLHHRLGPYEVESLLGRGGMGAVYLAHRADGQYQKKVAIKIVDLPLATEAFFDRFRLERQILAGLDHPNIARLLDGGISDEGILFLVMDYVDGIRIDTYCQTNHLSLERKLRLFLSVCAAVQFAHQNMVVHRDLKPDNVLVSEDGVPHLLDFGTAKLMSRENSIETRGLTRDGFLSFTPEYASPEQVLGRPVATTSDTYSLGVLLYQMLTGRLPYQLLEATPEEMIRVICERPIDRATATDGTFPNADLEAILGKALRKESDQRYQTAEQFAADVQAYLDQKPVAARKGNLRYRAFKFFLRNRLTLSFAAVLAVTVVAGVSVVLWQAHQTRLAEQASEQSANDLSRLTDTLLSELDDAIKQLPGSTGAQQVLVAKVLEHLDRMSKNPRSGVVTRISLVNAFVRLANLQGNHYEQNLGNSPGAVTSIDKALAIAESLGQAYPHDRDILLALARAQDARGEILSFTPDVAGAAASLQASGKTYDQLLALSPTSELFFEAGSAIDILGDVTGQDIGLSDAEGALRVYRRAIEFDHRALAIDPGLMQARRGLVSMQLKIGNVELETTPIAALGDFREAIAKLDALPQAEQSRLSLKRFRGLLLRKEGLALAELGRYSEAAPLFDQSRSICESLAAADPKDVRALSDIDRLFTNESYSYELALNPQLAEPGRSPAVTLAMAQKLEAERADILRRLIQMSPDDTDLTQALAAVTIRADSLQRSTDPDAQRRDRQALDLLKTAAFDSKASTLQLDRAFHAFTEVRPASLRDPSIALRVAQQGVALTHRRSPSWLLLLAQAYRVSGNSSQARAVAKEGLTRLPGDPLNREFCLQKQLEIETH